MCDNFIIFFYAEVGNVVSCFAFVPPCFMNGDVSLFLLFCLQVWLSDLFTYLWQFNKAKLTHQLLDISSFLSSLIFLPRSNLKVAIILFALLGTADNLQFRIWYFSFLKVLMFIKSSCLLSLSQLLYLYLFELIIYVFTLILIIWWYDILLTFLFGWFDLYQNPYVLCRLFKKNDESLEGSNEEVEQIASTPTTASFSPEEIQSDPSLVPVSSSLATEDDKHLPVIPEQSEEAISNIINPVDCHSDGGDAHDAKIQIIEPPAQVRLTEF